jgi:hypothetical protein
MFEGMIREAKDYSIIIIEGLVNAIDCIGFNVSQI